MEGKRLDAVGFGDFLDRCIDLDTKQLIVIGFSVNIFQTCHRRRLEEEVQLSDQEGRDSNLEIHVGHKPVDCKPSNVSESSHMLGVCYYS